MILKNEAGGRGWRGDKLDELNQALNELHVDIDSDDGKHVRIFCE